MKLFLIAATVLSASAAFAQTETLAETYQKTLDAARAAAAQQRLESAFDASMRAAGMPGVDPRDHDERNPVLMEYGAVISRSGRSGAAALVVSRSADEATVVALARHSLFGDLDLAAYASRDEFARRTGGGPAMQAFLDDLRAQYPYVSRIPDFVGVEARAQMTAAIAASRARDVGEDALRRDLASLGLSVSRNPESGVTTATKEGVTLSLVDYAASQMTITIQARHRRIDDEFDPPMTLRTYASIADLRAQTGDLAQLPALIAAASRD